MEHFKLYTHYVHNQVRQDHFHVRHIYAMFQVVNEFTKPISQVVFIVFRNKLIVLDFLNHSVFMRAC